MPTFADKDPAILAILPDLAAGYKGHEQTISMTLQEFGVEEVLELFSNGVLQAAVARKAGISPSSLWRYFHRYGQGLGPVEEQKLAARAQMWADAKRRSADALADKAMEIADDAPDSTTGVQKARLRVDTHKWRASTLNPDDYGQKNGPSVQVNLGDAFLESLERRRQTLLLSKPVVPPPGPDYEVVTNPEG
jgi:transposase-like protein